MQKMKQIHCLAIVYCAMVVWLEAVVYALWFYQWYCTLFTRNRQLYKQTYQRTKEVISYITIPSTSLRTDNADNPATRVGSRMHVPSKQLLFRLSLRAVLDICKLPFRLQPVDLFALNHIYSSVHLTNKDLE